MELTKTGIKGFDELVSGGFPCGSHILLSGTPGTGKTIFALEFLYNGATQFGEKGLYVTFEEKVDSLKEQAKQFGWDFDKLERERMAKIISIASTDLSKYTIQDILALAVNSKIQRLVIDSLSTLAINAPQLSSGTSNEFTVRRFVYSFINTLKELKGTTALFISQNLSNSALSGDQVSEFLCDGVLHISYESMGGNFSRSLIIRKMRRVKQDEDIHPLEISSSGIVIHKLE